MKQVLLDNELYVLRKEPYVINQDVQNASVIYCNCNSFEGFKLLNPDLDLTPYNYLILRKWTAPYYQYIDQLDDAEFVFEQGIVNVSSYVDQSFSGFRQEPIYPFDLDVSIKFYLNDEEMNSSAFTLTDAGQYRISAEIKDSKLYDDELQSYIINYEKVKRTATLSFNTASYEVSTYKDENYTGTLQQVNGIPAGQTVKYYIGNSLISGDSITLTEPGFYVVSARLEDSSIYNDTSTSYTISYQKQKRTANLSFTNSTVDVSTWIDENYSGTIQAVQNAPANVTIHYYLDNVELQGNSITLTSAGQHIIKAAIVSDEVYNDTFATYTINYVKNKRNATLSFANAVVNETVEDDTTYSGPVQAVTGLPAGQTANYYLGNTLISNGTISISDLQEGENTYTVTAAIENSSYYNDASCSYTLNITMEISSYENKYFTIEPLEDGTIKFTKNDLQYSTDRGTTWNTLTKDTSLGVTNGNNVIFKCTNPTINRGMGKFSSSGQFNVSGNIMSLYHGDNFKNQLSITQGFQFEIMFGSCSKLINAENLILPATTLANYCYLDMFNGCTSLTTAPELPATTLAQTCYKGMFFGCKSLVNAPELPSTTLAKFCYQSMFGNCTSLVNAPELPATTLEHYCYNDMFTGCTSLNYIKATCSPNSEINKTNWVQNVAATGTYIISDPNYNPNTDGIIYGQSCVPVGWTIKDYQGNVIHPKQNVTISFTNSVVNISTYVDEDYSGTIQSLNNVPSGVTPNYYLDSSLLSSNNITLTTTGNHKVVGAIENDANYNDSSASYTINYTQEKRDITFSATWNKQPDANGYEVGDSEYCPSPTMHQSPSSPSASPFALYNILDSSDNPLFSWEAGWPNNTELYTTAEGTYSCAVKYTISDDANYKPTEQICKWTYTVNAAQEQSSPYYVDLEAYVPDMHENGQGEIQLYNKEEIYSGLHTFQKIVPFYYDENENRIEEEPFDLSTLDENGGVVQLSEGSYNFRVYLNSSIIPAGAFHSCDLYTSIELSNGIYKVDTAAFNGCTSVQNLHLNDDGNLKIIGMDAFKEIDTASNTGINIVIPDSIEEIYDYAFGGEIPWNVCMIFAETPPYLGSYGFGDRDMLIEAHRTIQVPSDSVDVYKTASNKWSKYASVIVPM